MPPLSPTGSLQLAKLTVTDSKFHHIFYVNIMWLFRHFSRNLGTLCSLIRALFFLFSIAVATGASAVKLFQRFSRSLGILRLQWNHHLCETWTKGGSYIKTPSRCRCRTLPRTVNNNGSRLQNKPAAVLLEGFSVKGQKKRFRTENQDILQFFSFLDIFDQTELCFGYSLVTPPPPQNPSVSPLF